MLLWLLGYFLRALGMILIGAGLYRTGFMNGEMPAKAYRQIALIGLAIGLPLATAGVIITALNDYSREIAFIGQIPNTLGTIPASLGYMSLIILWNNSARHWLKQRLRAVGRMALTNYLTQTVLGVVVLTTLLANADFVNRSLVLVFVLAVWVLQIWWSQRGWIASCSDPQNGSGASLPIEAVNRFSGKGISSANTRSSSSHHLGENRL